MAGHEMNPGEGETRLPEQVGDLVEQLRRLSWEVRISRDQLLRAADGAPSSIHARAQGTAERLMGLHRKILEMTGELPADIEIAVPAKMSDDVSGLCGEGQLALRELDVLIRELHELFAETPVLQTN
jgi:hypothetical protein